MSQNINFFAPAFRKRTQALTLNRCRVPGGGAGGGVFVQPISSTSVTERA